MDEKSFQSGHGASRSLLRLFGIVFLIVGGGCILIAAIDFFSAFGDFGRHPTKFHFFFIGGPLVFVGLGMLQFGFMGAVLRYQAREVAPVGKDTFNYLAEGTREGVREIASAIGEGLNEGTNRPADVQVRCRGCNALLDEDARFCDQCGEAAQKTAACTACGELNDTDGSSATTAARRSPSRSKATSIPGL